MGFPHSLSPGLCHAEVSPNKGETAVHGCPYPLGMVMRIPDVLAGLWVGVYVPLALSLYFFSG